MIFETNEFSRKIEINSDWLYHWIIDEKMLYNVYRYGIMSKSNLRKNNIKFLRDNPSNVGCNGADYISICKRLNHNSVAYQRYIATNFAFIINTNIEKINSITEEQTIKRNLILQKLIGPKKILVKKSIVNSPDEYLVKNRITFDDIIGLKLPMFYDEEDILMLMRFLERIDYDLPIIDIENEIEIDKIKIKTRSSK